jgi:heterodisulfide reductase subunit A2
MKKDVLIIGGGIAGLWCAWELAAAGLDSVIVESAKVLGGHAAKLCCKATERCQRCGACLLEDVLHNVDKSPSITSLVRTTVDDVRRQDAHFIATLSCASEAASQVETRGVVIASGFSPFDPSEKPGFGWGRVQGVMTGMELESKLRDNNLDVQDLRKAAFIQCVGSRDPKLGRNYCSRVCCGYGLRLARLLRSRAPEIELSMFYMDIQSFDRDFEQRLAEATQEVRLIRAIPSEVRSGADGKPQLIYHGPDEARVVEPYDLVVLSVGISPGASTGTLAELLALKLNADGFLGENGEEVFTSRNGVFVAGTAQGPRSIEDAVSHAIRTAGEVASYIGAVSIGEIK